MYSVGNFFSTVTKFYNEINPATLSGAIDIVVVQQANGDLACSPFHVRFGKLSVLRPQEKVVEVRVNGQVIAFPMKVGDAGEAFFVLETDDYVPDEFATSPIAGPGDESELAPVDYFDLNGSKQQGAVGGQPAYAPADEGTQADKGFIFYVVH
jgi:phosphatidate phosphatase LPIN